MSAQVVLSISLILLFFFVGGGKRKGSFAIYLEPWHADIFAFLDLKKNVGSEEERARDLFYALWVNDLFMKRVEANEDWSLMCPNECPGLPDVYGEEFEQLYIKYEQEGRARKVVKAQTLWQAIITSQQETGTPYISYKDAVNRKSNHKNLGTIRSSNLCVAGETFVLTSDGNKRIDTLVDQTVRVWNGHEWSETTVRKTSNGSTMMKVTISNGKDLICTPEHKFWVLDEHKSLVEKPALNLSLADELFVIDDSLQRQIEIVTNLELDCMYGPTYCFTEPKRHMGVFNGLLTGQCNEIVQYTSPDDVAVCNLASIGLPKFIEDGKFNHLRLFDVTKVITRNLNKVIDRNFYPVEAARHSNMKTRPMGIGVQGLADVFAILRYPFDSPEAQELNREIFETMYFAALSASVELAKVEGPYPEFKGSPYSRGELQFDYWEESELSGRWDWTTLRENMKTHGVRNSLFIACMPTASSSQFLDNNECIEPFNSNIYVRRTLSGEFVRVNKHLLKDLIELGIWNETLKNKIVRNKGSVQGIAEIPKDIQHLYRTAWEIPMREQLLMSADRGAFIDQTQSLNCHMVDADYQKITSMHFYGWKKGLKTGMYYLRTKAAADAIQYTLDPTKKQDEEDCHACSA